MKTFKQFKKKKDEDNDFAVLSDVIHFKAGVDGEHNTDDKFEPSVKKDKSHYVKEERRWKNFEEWRDKNENTHLGRSHNKIGEALRHSESPLYAKNLHNPNETVKPGTKKEKYLGHYNAIDAYTQSSKAINKALISNKTEYFEKERQTKRLRALDETTDEHRAQHDHTLYSGLTFDPRKKLKGKDKFISPAFSSATHSKEIATNFTKPIKNAGAPPGSVATLPKMHKTHHILRINVPKGAKSMNISSISQHPEEHESLIGRNAKFEYSHEEKLVDKFGNNYLIHHVSLLP